MIYANISYNFGKYIPRSNHSNNSFSVYSPTNANLFDTMYPASYGPYVATGGGYALNFGIARLSIFGDAYQLNDLILPDVGVDIKVTDKWSVSFDYWYLRSFEHAIGIQNSRAVTLSSDLGHELDFSIAMI